MLIASAVYRLALSLWVGGIALFTFVATPVIFRTQGRDAAGRIVGAIFPLYFRYGLALAGAALLARIFSGEAFHGGRQWAGTALIVTALLLTGYQAYGLTPAMERVKRSVPSFETTAPDDPARREFSRLHGISMVVNLVVLLEGAALIVAGEAFRR
ncbi:MAG TPA: DUF4149 domain-containing protein [Candidatus Deferrimicrobiaceae bacterium]